MWAEGLREPFLGVKKSSAPNGIQLSVLFCFPSEEQSGKKGKEDQLQMADEKDWENVLNIKKLLQNWLLMI